MNKLEFLAAKLYCIRSTGGYLYPASIDNIIKEMGREVSAIPYNEEQQQEDEPQFISVSREELDYIHKALEDALATPSEELLPDSVTHAEAMLFKILTRIVNKSA